jgi:hypothetical protein
MAYTLVLNNRRHVRVDSVEAARAAFDKYAAGRILRASTYHSSPLICHEAGAVVGYFSMNGRYWTRETGHGTTPDKTDFDLMTARYWGAHVAKALAP